MDKKYVILFYVALFSLIVSIYPTELLSYSESKESITQYIISLSKDIFRSIETPSTAVLDSSKGELKIKVLLSPWGELKDAYISESSGNDELDESSLKAARSYDLYQPFPEELGDEELWLDLPIIFENLGTHAPNHSFSSGTGHGLRVKKLTTHDPGSGRPGVVGGGLDEMVDVALENRIGAKIAQEEIELSRLKIREANRALYPAATLNYLETIGLTTALTQDFTDKEYKVKFEYPLYYGWRLKYAVKQAVSNMKASKYNYDKISHDLRGDVEEAYYSYITNRAALRLQESLLKEVEKIFDIAKKRFDVGLTTKVEFLEVESKLKQIKYQVASSQNELAMARLTLAQAMNVKDTEELSEFADVDLDFNAWQPVHLDVSLEQCIDMAFKYRPDIKSKGYMVDFNDYERKIAISKNQFKVDLTGSYGKSGGAYESESLELAKDWFIGLKASKPLGGNTLSAVYTKEETSEKHGQSTRTESISRSVELGLLDNLQSFSEKKSSEIAFSKARAELQKTQDAILKEVKESYLNYKKGLLQIESNLKKVSHKKEELKIAKAQAELNEVPFSGLLRSHMQFTDEQTFYIESVGSLLQALSKLNRSTGYALLSYDGSIMLANLE